MSDITQIPGALVIPSVRDLTETPGATAIPEPRVTQAERPRSAFADFAGRMTGLGPDSRALVSGAVDDTLGISNRPEADVLGRAVFKPQNLGESLILPAITAPIIGAGGAVATALRLPAFTGRLATTGAISKAKGESNTRAALDMAGAAVGEGVMGALGAIAGRFAGGADALQEIAKRVGRGPDATVNLTLLHRLVERITSAPNAVARDVALRNAVQQINNLAGLRVEPGLGNAFRRFVIGAAMQLPLIPAVRMPVPLPAGQVAAATRDVAQSNAARAAMDAAVGRHPFSDLAAMLAAEHATDVKQLVVP